MPYDPNLPASSSRATSAELRGQFQGLKELIDALQTITAAQVDAVNTVNPGDPAQVVIEATDGTLHFTFDIPKGDSGSDGSQGPQGIQGEQGVPGAPGEVTLQQLTDAVATTSSNSNNVATLGMTVNDPPTQAEVQAVADKLDELITALRR